MRRVIPDSVLWDMAQTATYDQVPNLYRSKREYASRVGFTMPLRTPADKERFDHILEQLKAIESERVPREEQRA